MDIIRIYHFHNGTGGGVLSVIQNLLKYSQNFRIENHIIYTINKDLVRYYEPLILKGARSQQVFYYSPDWNFYYTCKQLNKLLPDSSAVIVANDWLELGMVSNLGLQNPVVQILHGDYSYYYDLAKSHQTVIDTFITVSDSIAKNLSFALPNRKDEIKYLRFPVPDNDCKSEKSINYAIAFIGRCSKAKGYHMLPEIAEMVELNGVKLQWHIIGEEDKSILNNAEWSEKADVVFHGVLSNEAVTKLLCGMHFFILPTLAEGMPLSLVEAMKAGVVPLVNDLPGGIQELVLNGETGYRVSGNLPALYAKYLSRLCSGNSALHQLRINAIQIANRYFAPRENTMNYETEFIKATKRNIHKSPVKAYGSRLDAPWLSNLIVKTIRKFKTVK